MKRSRLKNIINKSKSISNKQEVGNPFDEFKQSLPIEVDDNYRLEAAWKAYGSPKDYKTALWYGMIQPIDETNVKLPSIGYNEETDEYEYLNKGEDNETVAKDIRVWDNDVIPLVKELKQGGYVRLFNKEKDCWTYTKNSQKEDTLDLNQGNILKELSGELINSFLKGGKTRDIVQLIEEAKKLNPRFIQRLSEPYKAILFDPKNEGKLYDGTHYMYADKDGLVFPTILEMEDKSLKYFENINEARERAIKNNNVLRFSPEEAIIFRDNYKLGWKKFFDEGEEIQRKKVGWFKKDGKWFRSDGEDSQGKRYIDDDGGLWYFKQGGQMNVIPEGALHARKNNMELAKEGEVTHKGVPVVDNDGVQQAEVEKEEWTMTKELTEDVEKWYKKYYDEETSQKEKDELAIKCGKRIVEELLHNTDDRADLISKIEEEM